MGSKMPSVHHALDKAYNEFYNVCPMNDRPRKRMLWVLTHELRELASLIERRSARERHWKRLHGLQSLGAFREQAGCWPGKSNFVLVSRRRLAELERA